MYMYIYFHIHDHSFVIPVLNSVPSFWTCASSINFWFTQSPSLLFFFWASLPPLPLQWALAGTAFRLHRDKRPDSWSVNGYCEGPLHAVMEIRRPLAAVRGSAPRKLLQKIVVERWGKAPARIRCFVRLVCCFAWLEHESCCCSSVSKALLHGTSSCCGPVGTALPKAPARIRCFVQLVCGFAWFSLNGFQ